ncbi:MAG: AAA family ATPase, partial [Candidatus Paceibacterota bacterium]
MGILPKEKVKVTNRNPKKLVIYGPPKVGKTALLAALENNLIIDLETGSSHIEALKIQANNFDDLQKIGTEIIKEGKPYTYITIDTVTELENWCETLATKMYKNTPQGMSFAGNTVLELGYGAGYYWLR